MRAIARIAGRVRRSRARVSTARPLYRQNWVVYLKPPFGGPEYVLQYLGRYTHRVAISNHRLVSFTEASYTSFHKASCASVTSTSVLCQPPAHQELLSSRPQPQAEQHASSTEDTPGLYRCPPLWRTNERATRHRGRNPGPWASVARVARRNDVNANQVFYWRKLFREGRLGISMNPQLLPV